MTGTPVSCQRTWAVMGVGMVRPFSNLQMVERANPAFLPSFSWLHPSCRRLRLSISPGLRDMARTLACSFLLRNRKKHLATERDSR
jgi:hypothetical protein